MVYYVRDIEKKIAEGEVVSSGAYICQRNDTCSKTRMHRVRSPHCSRSVMNSLKTLMANG